AAIENAPAARVEVVHAARAHEHPRVALEVAVRGEWHPVAFQFLERHLHRGLRAPTARLAAPRALVCQPKVDPICAEAARSRGTNSMARISGRRAVAACIAIAAITSPCRLRPRTATQATPRTYASFSPA